MKSLVALAALVLLTAPLAPAQSLGDAARRERERREKNKEQGVKPVRVITQDDVKTNDRATGSWNETSATKDSAPKDDSSSTAAASSDDQASKEQYWRGRAQAARARLEAAQAKLAKTPEGIMSESPGARGLTAAEQAAGVRPLEGVTGGRGVVPNPAYPAAKAEVAEAEKALRDLEEEARGAGALPGWLR